MKLYLSIFVVLFLYISWISLVVNIGLKVYWKIDDIRNGFVKSFSFVLLSTVLLFVLFLPVAAFIALYIK